MTKQNKLAYDLDIQFFAEKLEPDIPKQPEPKPNQPNDPEPPKQPEPQETDQEIIARLTQALEQANQNQEATNKKIDQILENQTNNNKETEYSSQDEINNSIGSLGEKENE